MKLSFKDYTIISDAFIEMQLDEGAVQDLWAAVKKKLGGKASDDQIEAEIERLKKTRSSDLNKIKDTVQSREFHQRQAEREKAALAKQAKPTQPTVSTRGPNTEASFRAKSVNDMRGGERRALDRNPFHEGKKEDADEWQEGYKYAKAVRAGKAKEDLNGVSTAFKQGYRTGMNESVQLDEAQKEYRVEYTTKLSNADSKVKVAKIKAMDVAAVREKFKRDFHGMKLLTIKPA